MGSTALAHGLPRWNVEGNCTRQASCIPERLFMVAAEAVANSLDDDDIQLDSVVPHRDRIANVSLNVATAVVVEAQSIGIAGKRLGEDREQVKVALEKLRWLPQVQK